MSPHPVVRLLALGVATGLLFRYSVAGLAVMVAGVLAMARWLGKDTLSGVLKAMRRIRWLLISIAVIYLYVAPIGPFRWIPALPDVLLAAQRAGILVVLVGLVELLRRTTPVERLAAAIAALLSPFRWIGLHPERFAQRMALTLEAVPKTAEIVSKAAGERRVEARNLRSWGAAAARLVESVESHASTAAPLPSLPALGRPGLLDWGWLAAAIAAVWAVSRL